MTNKLTNSDYEQCANLLGVNVAIIRAIVDVEAAGYGFLSDGRPKILFERHWFYKLTPLPVSRTRPDLSNRKPGGYLGGSREWERLNAAILYDRTAALKSASWGLGQIMGFNHAASGYPTVENFVVAMHESEGKQLQAMMQFIKHDTQMHSALRSNNFAQFAKLYNGIAYRRNAYDTKLAAAYQKYIV